MTRSKRLTIEKRIGAAGAAVVGVAYGMGRFCFGLTLPDLRVDPSLSATGVPDAVLGLIAGGTFAGFLAGIIGAVFLHLIRPDASATFATFVLQILGLATVAAGTFYGLGKVNEKVEAVAKQTNGTLSKKDDEIQRLRDELRRVDRARHPSEFDIDGTTRTVQQVRRHRQEYPNE